MPMNSPGTLVIVVTGVAGAGKTTIGKALAARLGLEFYEGDDFHPAANRAKMSAGVALTDEDREPWLAALSSLIDDLMVCDIHCVLSCSALRADYRRELMRPGVRFIHLRVPLEIARERLQHRKGHFLDPSLVASQFAVLQESTDQVSVDASRSVDCIVDEIEQLVRSEDGP